jgi:hypothetical protein
MIQYQYYSIRLNAEYIFKKLYVIKARLYN